MVTTELMDLRNLSTALNHCKLKNRLQTNAAVAWLGFGILRRTVFLKGRVLPVFVAYPVVDPGLFFRLCRRAKVWLLHRRCHSFAEDPIKFMQLHA